MHRYLLLREHVQDFSWCIDVNVRNHHALTVYYAIIGQYQQKCQRDWIRLGKDSKPTLYADGHS